MQSERVPDIEVDLCRQLLRTRSDISLLKQSLGKAPDYKSKQPIQDNLEVVCDLEQELVEKIRNSFGVIFPEDTLIDPSTNRPSYFQESQKIYCIDWFEKIRIQESEDFFKTTICFRCPFSYKDRSSSYGEMCEHEVNERDMKRSPHECLAVDEHSFYGITNYGKLYDAIRNVHGEKALEDFKAYRDEIR